MRIDQLGEGLSQVIGTGGRDLREEIGGLMMIQGIEALLNDPETEVIVLVSKPPHPTVEKKIIDLVKQADKPVVIDFIGGDASIVDAGATPCLSLEDAARKAVALLRGEKVVDFDGFDASEEEIEKLVSGSAAKLSAGQKYLRALYTGGTLADEAIKYLGDHYPIYSNIPLTPDRALANLEGLNGHICLDLGEDEFTRGRPHPMIDPLTRADFFKTHVNSSTAVVLCDVVIGYGAHENPAGAVAASVSEARERLKAEGKDLVVVASVTGPDKDPQGLDQSIASLEQAGVIVMPSNAQAVRLVDLIMEKVSA